MTKVLMDVKDAVLESVIGFRGSKALKDTFIGSAKINLEDVIDLKVVSDDEKEIAAVEKYFSENTNKFVDKDGHKIEQLVITINKIEDSDAKGNVKEFEEPTFYTKSKAEVQFGNNLDHTGKARLVVYFGYNEDYDRNYTRMNTAIFDDVANVVVHPTNGVTDEDFNF